MTAPRTFPLSTFRRGSFAFVGAILLALSGSGLFGCARGTVETRVAAPASTGDREEIRVFSPREGGEAELPLVVVLHGYGADPFRQELYFNLRARVAEKRFRLAYLAGTRDRAGRRFWNASPACCNLDGSTVDDVAYVAEAIAAIRARLPVSRVHLAGHSNGGFMAFRLACELGGKIDGVFALAAADEKRGCPARAYRGFRLVLAHGTADAVIASGGGSFRGLPRHGSADETRALWEARLGCAPAASGAGAIAAANYSWGIPGDDSAVVRRDCGEGNRLVAIRIEGGSHIPWINSRFRTDVLGALLDP